MKKLTLIIAIIFSGMLMQAQEDYESPRDVIYPYDENISTIRGVKIVDVLEGNIVLYKRDKKSYQIKASAIYRDGEYTVLRKGETTYSVPSLSQPYNLQKSADYNSDQEYLRYKALYEGAKRRSGVGGVFTVIGTIGIVAGAIMLYDDTYHNDEGATIAYLGGSLLFNIGVPLWISGGVRKRNNYNAMEKRKNELSLSLVPSSYRKGVGIRFAF